MTDWDDRHIARLRVHVSEGLSGSMISAELKREFGKAAIYSRCAVLGKAARLGLKIRPSRINPVTTRDARSKASIPAKQLIMSKCESARIEATNTAIVSRVIPTIHMLPVTFAQLKHIHCRWPLGDPHTPEFRFCGAARLGEKPYCAGHFAQAYLPYQRPGRAKSKPTATSSFELTKKP